MEELPELPPKVPLEDIETRAVLKKLPQCRAALAEVKGVTGSVPNQQILIDTLSLQEAKHSSAVENIVTTHDEMYKGDHGEGRFASPAAKEVHHYADALKSGFRKVKEKGLITTNMILEVQKVVMENDAGIRKLPGTVLRNEQSGETIFEPPQDPERIKSLLKNLEHFMNDGFEFDTDPLIKMALIHYQFESIHPFYDGNGRTGRIINLLYLIKEGLLDLPVLYISRYIIRNREKYYALLQDGRGGKDCKGNGPHDRGHRGIDAEDQAPDQKGGSEDL